MDQQVGESFIHSINLIDPRPLVPALGDPPLWWGEADMLTENYCKRQVCDVQEK